MKNSKKFFQKKVKKNTYFQKKVLISNNYGFFELKNFPLLGKLWNSIIEVVILGASFHILAVYRYEYAVEDYRFHKTYLEYILWKLKYQKKEYIYIYIYI